MPFLAIAGVIALAAALRLYAFTWGLPDETHMFSYHPDEFHSLRGALSLAMGDPNPHFFNYGSLYLYLVAIAAMIGSPGVFASVAGATAGGPELPAAIQAWTLDARVVTLILSLATVYVVYLIAARIWGHRAGLLAAGALAVMPLHVVHSHYATVDVPGAFFVALALYFAVRIVDQPTGRNLIWAGVASGLAASVKYSGGLVIVAPLVAWMLADARPRWQAPVIIIACAAAAFVVTSPYTILDGGNAWRDIGPHAHGRRCGGAGPRPERLVVPPQAAQPRPDLAAAGGGDLGSGRRSARPPPRAGAAGGLRCVGLHRHRFGVGSLRALRDGPAAGDGCAHWLGRAEDRAATEG
jgi:hypothetical protein